jgi:hypothetical protein
MCAAHKLFAVLAFAVGSLFTIGSVRAASPASPSPGSTYVDKLSPTEERVRLVGELQSGDAARIAAAMQEIRACALAKGHPNAWDLEVLDRAGRPEEVEPLAIEGMIEYAANPEAMAQFELARVRAFTAARKLPEAEGAAKGYYNLVMLKDTSKAITTVSMVLISAHPDDPGIASRFKAQQLAGANDTSAQPATQPDLGPSILAAIKVDASPFEKAIGANIGVDYPSLVAKGDLLLAADRGKDAHMIFDAALELAGPPQLPRAVENVARAIRAESGAIAPANAYLASLSSGQSQPEK